MNVNQSMDVLAPAERANLILAFPDDAIYDSSGLDLHQPFALKDVEIRAYDALLMAFPVRIVPLVLIDRAARVIAAAA